MLEHKCDIRMTEQCLIFSWGITVVIIKGGAVLWCLYGGRCCLFFGRSSSIIFYAGAVL